MSIMKAVSVDGDRPELVISGMGSSVGWREMLRSREDLPPALKTSLAAALVTLIENCWAQDPLDRPQFKPKSVIHVDKQMAFV